MWRLGGTGGAFLAIRRRRSGNSSTAPTFPICRLDKANADAEAKGLMVEDRSESWDDDEANEFCSRELGTA